MAWVMTKDRTLLNLDHVWRIVQDVGEGGGYAVKAQIGPNLFVNIFHWPKVTPTMESDADDLIHALHALVDGKALSYPA